MYINRYQIPRNILKITILALFFIGFHYNIHILIGNLSAAILFDYIPLADPLAVIQIFASGAIAANKTIIGALIILAFYAIIGGRSFCSWICPVSSITEIARWLRTKIKGDETGVSLIIRRSARYWILALAIILSALFSIAAFEFISPISIFHRGVIYGMGFGWTILIVVFLFDLFAIKDGFCGHLCPLGAFYSIISRFSLLKIRFIQSKCTDCKDCIKTCPEPQVLPNLKKADAIISSGECSLCAKCIEVCQTSALVWTRRTTLK